MRRLLVPLLLSVATSSASAQAPPNKEGDYGGVVPGEQPEPGKKPKRVAKAKSNHEMREAVVTAEKRAVADYTQRAKDADAFGDKGLAVQLEDMVRDETGHKEETERMLRDWPL